MEPAFIPIYFECASSVWYFFITQPPTPESSSFFQKKNVVKMRKTLLICKFSGSKSGAKVFVVLDLEAFAEIVNRPCEIQEELDKTIWKMSIGKTSEDG